MKLMCVIPARYESTRFPGKPLADICGKPMIQWVYEHCSQVERFERVIVATDDDRISGFCRKAGMDYVMTRRDHPNHISRVQEVSESVGSDHYVCINGDEPLLMPETICEALPPEAEMGSVFFSGAYRVLTDPVETIDGANIKLALNDRNECIYMSRAAVPFPKGSIMFSYNKYVGIEVFSKEALDFFVSTKMGHLEKIEDIDHLRFLENGKVLKFRPVSSESISVDTKNDLEKVRVLMKETLEKR
ncbi:3-deoxy-manno-octulosonate cytidylyltransferase [Methanomassiliicoccales archaeon LGM-DZ1]|nr:3-deoxy-manno-octulosonate cytidylyltransferase [Methanomassiliicoccales archaeon LGM-DZ1]